MISLFVFLTLFAILSPADALYKHSITPEKVVLNDRVKDELPEIVRIKSIPGHDNLEETLDDFLKVLNDEVKYPLNHLLILNRAPSVTVLNGQLGERVTQKTIDNLTSLLPSANYEQAGDLSATELDPLTRFTEELALTYARIFSEQFHEEKEVRVVPITKLKAYDEDRQHYFKTQDKPYSVVLGVFGRRKGSSEKLKGIGGVLARLNL